ncbi:MAG: glycosyl hydrolase family 65 protein [Fimbriimonas sp.]|nr:glycosyl hydrolase family 65 protein [Fimbriimonas sp.]
MMKYDLGVGEFENWVVAETRFSTKYLGKAESIMMLGNGYLGLRSATDEPYLGETRDLLVAGTFNKFNDDEVTEIPNAADVTRLDIQIDGERFSLEFGETAEYFRSLNLKSAELTRSFVWTSPRGKVLRFIFRRFVSMVDLHLIACKVEVTALNDAVELIVDSGIDIRMTNSGSQHFSDGVRRIHDRSFIQQVQTTNESKIDFVVSTHNLILIDGRPPEAPGVMEMDRRKVWMHYLLTIEKGETLRLEKLSSVWTTRDRTESGVEPTLDQIKTDALEHLRLSVGKGYDGLQAESAAAWGSKVWGVYDIDVEAERPFDLLAIRFAIYHIVCMTPSHDDRMGIAAKGLSGEGYKGHSFWDTELFILPFYSYSHPEVARSLLTYRFRGLAGAHKKAAENSYRGAMYPWEMAWPTDGEVTPVWGAVDVVTGKQTKIWSGFIEQHITADIAYAVSLFHQITGDEQFMLDCGYEMIIDTAIFWLSRFEHNAELDRYEITNVVGPDEYKEHADNNAFTNYMAKFNIELALAYADRLQQQNLERYDELSSKLGIPAFREEAAAKLTRIYIPLPNEEGLIPQDDKYLTYPSIDLAPYKNREKVGMLFYEFSLDQVNRIQVSKQADVVILLYLLGYLFPPDVIRRNFDYYEARTLHDSSLSLSTHAVMANDLGYSDMAYELFHQAARIDLGENMKSSDAGIHAASIGGIWQIVVLGFGGVRVIDGELTVHPRLPKGWKRLSFTIRWKGAPIVFDVTQDRVRVSPPEGTSISFLLERVRKQIDTVSVFALASQGGRVV